MNTPSTPEPLTARTVLRKIAARLPFDYSPLKIRIIAGAALLLLIIILYLVFSGTGVDTQIPVYQVKRDKLLVSITESGEINATNAVSVTSPRVRGNLKIVALIAEGTRVKAGDTVIQFDPTEAINSLKDAESKLEVSLSEKAKLEANQKSAMIRSENDVKNADLTFELSTLNLEQMKFEAEVKQREAQLQHRRNELNLLRTKQDLESQKIVQRSEMNKVDIDIMQRKSDLEKAKKDLEQLTLSAPQDGLVVYEQNWSTGRKIAIGDSPWPGMTLISLPDLSSMQSTTYVNEVDVSRVRKGLRVFVTLDAFRDSTFEGEITNVAPLGKSKEGNSSIKVFEINVGILSQSEILKPGMTTSNKIIIRQLADIISVPQEAVFQKRNKHIVFVKNGSGFEEREVELGVKSDDMIAVIKGLRDNETVALLDPNQKEDTRGPAESQGTPEPPGKK
jgi:RND family efflux transporter MFP subunit